MDKKLLKFGWLHWSSRTNSYIQQTCFDGATREVTLKGPKDYPIKTLIKLARDLFSSPESEKTLEGCKFEMGLFKSNKIDEFRDKAGNVCSIWQYIKEFRPPRFHLYLYSRKLDTFQNVSENLSKNFDSLGKSDSCRPINSYDEFYVSPPKVSKLMQNVNQTTRRSMKFKEIEDPLSQLDEPASIAGVHEKPEKSKKLINELPKTQKRTLSGKIVKKIDRIQKNKMDVLEKNRNRMDLRKLEVESALKGILKSRTSPVILPQIFPDNKPVTATIVDEDEQHEAGNLRKSANVEQTKIDIGFKTPLPIVSKNHIHMIDNKNKIENQFLNEKASPLNSSSILESSNVALIHGDDFEITLTSLGSGTFGKVRQGRWDNKDVAIKSMEYLSNVNNDINITREVVIAQRLNHENLMKIFGVCLEPQLENPTFHIMMEFFCRDNLYDVIFDPIVKKQHQLSEYKKNAMSLQICEGVKYLHQKKVLHRDIKPKNILVAITKHEDLKNAFVKLCDFGLSVCTSISASVASILSSRRENCGHVHVHGARNITESQKTAIQPMQ